METLFAQANVKDLLVLEHYPRRLHLPPLLLTGASPPQFSIHDVFTPDLPLPFNVKLADAYVFLDSSSLTRLAFSLTIVVQSSLDCKLLRLEHPTFSYHYHNSFPHR